MGNRVWHQAFFAMLCSALFLFAGSVQAASLGKIEVASHLGEAFFAEVPLKLEANELVSKVFVEIAAPADYKIFEVYRDPILKAIRADVASDARGARVELSSRSRIRAPFFNLVLKIRYGRVSHFKKFPVFLDVSKAVQQAAQKAPEPSVAAVKQPVVPARSSLTESAGQTIAPSTAQAVAKKQKIRKPFQGWARTDRYGPIVRGDSLSIVAERLRVDYRYTRNQIMLALFNKNRADFERDNMNLMKAGSFLKVPTADEVEQHSKLEATRAMAEHEKNWKQLTRQPRYAAEAEAQRTRYTKRISIGEHADGVAAAPVAAMATAVATAANKKPATDHAHAAPAPVTSPATPVVKTTEPATANTIAEASTVAPAEASTDQAVQAQSQTLIRLQEQNEVLKQQLIGTQKNIEDLSQKVEQAQAATAEKAHIKKLEVMVAGLQSELKKMRQPQPAQVATGMNWMLWLLIALVLLMLGIIAVLMRRREPAHPGIAADSTGEGAGTISADSEATQQTTAHDMGGSDALASVVENELADIETGETPVPVDRETATIDSLPAFTDELSDTDTTELEPFNADSITEPDPDIDYISEADVYIRYGMDDEALKQLDMALHIQPDNVEAHIKKAELLLGKSDRQGLDASIAVATMTLTAVDLDRFKSFIEEMGEDVAQVDADEAQQVEHHDRMEPPLEPGTEETVSLDASVGDDLDFDLAGLDKISDELTGELDLPDIERQPQQDETIPLDSMADDESEDLPWLHDEVFDGVVAEDALSLEPQAANDAASEIHSSEIHSSEKQTEDKTAATDETETAALDVMGGATQELDNLLSEFSDQHMDETHMDETGMDNPESGATRQLDQLLSEFDDEDEPLAMADTVGARDEAFFEPDASGTTDHQDEMELATDHGATQELDHLLSEFANEEDGLLEIDPNLNGLDDAALDVPDLNVPDLDDATDANVATDSEDAAGATQVLGRLLDEFKDDELNDEEDQDKKR